MRYIALIAALGLAACEPARPQYTAEMAASRTDAQLCRDMRTFAVTRQNIARKTAIDEYAKRNPRVSEQHLNDMFNYRPRINMPESIALCAIPADLVGQSIGYGRNTRQYRTASGLHFFIENGRVVYISG